MGAEGAHPRSALLLSPAILAVVVAVSLASSLSDTSFTISITTEFLPLLVLGQLTYLVATGRIRVVVAGGYGVAAWVIFIVCLEKIYPQNLVPEYSYPSNAMLAYLIFLLAVVAEGRARPLRALQILSKRSYSLYLVHAPVGLTILGLLSHGTRLPYTLELAIALVAVALATELSYRFVERPSQALGRRLAQRRRLKSSRPGRELS